MIQLTEEQQAIVGCDLAPGETLKIAAFAGTGKTSTLVAYAQARPQLRFLYLAFNKGVQLEAQQRFPGNVTCKTTHGQAFRTHGHRHKERLVTGFKANQVMAALDLDSFEDARFTIDTLCNYLISATPKVTHSHIPYAAQAHYIQQNRSMPDLVALANRLGRLMCNGSEPRIGMLHDGYLKLYQLSDPVLVYDCILLDEAQDLSPVISSLVLAQKQGNGRRPPAAVILVGDSHQQIYSFRGARDTLKKIKTDQTRYLSRSFRFNNNIARVANMVLTHFKGESRSIVGTPNVTSKPAWNPQRHTIIARTNATLFNQAVDLYRSRKIGFVGGIQGYRLNLIRDGYYLRDGKPDRVQDGHIRGFKTFTELKSYAGAVEDLELLSICKVVETYGSQIPELVKKISDQAVDAERAQILLTTAHKAKGLEWDHVLLMGDFVDLVQQNELVSPEEIDPDEFNLIYVAMTRSIHNLRFHNQSSLPEFIKTVQRTRKK